MRICSVSANQQFELDKQETDKMTLGLMILMRSDSYIKDLWGNFDYLMTEYSTSANT